MLRLSANRVAAQNKKNCFVQKLFSAMALTRLPGGMAPWLVAQSGCPCLPRGWWRNPAVRVCPMAGGGNPAARLAPWLMAAIWAVRAGPVAGRGNLGCRCGLAPPDIVMRKYVNIYQNITLDKDTARRLDSRKNKMRQCYPQRKGFLK